MYRIVHARGGDPRDFVASVPRAIARLEVAYPRLVFARGRDDAEVDVVRVWEHKADYKTNMPPVALIYAEGPCAAW